MMIEQHYDDEVLIGLIDQQTIDPHLQSCETCKASLDSLRNVTSALHDPAVWDERELSEEPRRETKHALRSFASSVAADDAAAEPRVKALLAKPASEWHAIVDAHPEWRTAGFVRKLIAAVDAINFSAPTDAVELTRIAVDVAEAIDNAKVRALAWKEYAYALHYIGSYAPAFEAIDRCDDYLRQCPVNDYDRANAMLVRSSILGQVERVEEALRLARSARGILAQFGAARRVVVASMHEAGMLMRLRRWAEALPMYSAIIADSSADAFARAGATNNAAMCSRELSDLVAAKRLFAETVAAFDALKMPFMRSKARWNFANILVQEQQYAPAVQVFEEVRADFQELGIAHDVALIAVDAAEALLLAGRLTAVADLCRDAMEYFRAADLAYTQGALTALAYLREAVEAQALTVRDVAEVRAFFEILPKQPELLFARPA